MSYKSVRIPTTVGGNDKYLTVKLENNIDFFEILSLKISQKDIYGSFNSDYGVIVGRVIANDGISVPNAKISVFIPISDEDKSKSDIVSVYPYTSPRDKDLNGVRYNLLPRVAVNNPFIAQGQYAPAVPVGTFPTKEEITTNQTYLEVYEKYYKFTTVSNTSGDYMIFGVPIGIQTVHMSVDITDIGAFSMTPGTMINNLGYSPNLFTENQTKIKFSTDLETLPNIETQEVAVEVRPFWGDTENFEIGITRQDFKIRATIVGTFSIFGTVFTDAFYSSWGVIQPLNQFLNRMIANADLNDVTDEERYRFNLDIESKRNGDIDITVFYYPRRISDDDIIAGNVDTANDIVVLQKNEYTSILDKGQFILTIPCNRRKKVFNENGDFVDTDDDDVNGIFTEFWGFITIKYGSDLTNYQSRSSTDGNRVDIVKIKIPQSAPIQSLTPPQSNEFPNTPNSTFTFQRGTPPNGTANSIVRNERWRKQSKKFEIGKLYSVAKFNGTVHGTAGGNQAYGTVNNKNANPARNSGSIVADSSTESQDIGMVFNTTTFINYSNANASNPNPQVKVFAAEWLNFAVYLPQFKITTASTTDISDNVTDYKSDVNGMVITNTQLIAGTERDTSLFLRSDYHPTDFIEVPREDIVKMVNTPKKGFYSNNFISDPLSGTEYKGTEPTKYFFKGVGNADCIQFLIDNGIV